ncbi:hypothetical protein Btru_029585 [Bulinus truncatus]|nr:hypothetical protein Btru_029585 [Bulinus truncatus]
MTPTEQPPDTDNQFNIIAAVHNRSIPSITTAMVIANVSDEERVRYLDSLQDVTTSTMIPAMVFLTTLAVTGLIGNSLVLFVYSQRFTRTSTRVYVLVIAALDVIANVIGIPGEIYDMFHIWDFDNRPLCRARLFFNSFSTLSSAMVLLAVAVTRYRKVCVPYGWQTTIKQARIISFVLVLLGIIFSLPYVIISGRQTKKTDRPDITGFECTTDDTFVGTKWPLLTNGFFLLLFIVCSVPLIAIYIKIGIQARKHSTIHGSTSTGLRTLPPNSSSTDHQDVHAKSHGQRQDAKNKHSVKSKISLKRRKSKAAASSESDDVASTHGEFSESSFHRTGSSDKYIVRILEDTVEITTPMMGQFIVQLKKASDTGEVGALCGDELENTSGPNEDIYTLNDSSGVVFEGQNSFGKKSLLNILGVDNIAFKNEEEGASDMNQSGGQQPRDINNSLTASHSQDQSNRHDIKMVGQENGNCISVSQMRVNTFDHSVPESNVNTNIRVTGQNDQLDSTDQTKTTERNVQTATPDVLVNDTRKDISEHQDPSTSLRWVDIVFCPQHDEEYGPGRSDPRSSHKDSPPLSFRMSPTNALLQRTDWLRNLISLALARKKDRKQEEVFVCDESMLGVKLPQTLPSESDVDDDVFTPSSNQFEPAPRTSRDLAARLRSVVSWTRKWRKFSSRASGQSGRRPLGRTTAMLIIISAFFVGGFIPYLILTFFKLTAPDSYDRMTVTEQAVYNLFLRTYFINCAVNPIIYSFCDRNFRKECVKLMKCSRLRC